MKLCDEDEEDEEEEEELGLKDEWRPAIENQREGEGWFMYIQRGNLGVKFWVSGENVRKEFYRRAVCRWCVSSSTK